MITLERQPLLIRFPDIHKHAVARISFRRTLRIPDDGNDYPGMGQARWCVHADVPVRSFMDQFRIQ